MSEYYGVRFPNGEVSPVLSLSSARGFARVWGKTGTKAVPVRHTPDGWRRVADPVAKTSGQDGAT